MDGSNNEPVPAQTNMDGSNNEPVPAQTNMDGSNNEPVPAQTNMDGSNNEPVPAQTNMDGSSNEPVPAQTNVDVSNNEPVLAQSNVDGSNNEPVPAQTNMDGSNNEPVPAQTNIDVSNNDSVLAQRNVDGSNDALVPAQRNVDGSNDELVPAQRNLDGSNDAHIPAQRNVDGSNNELFPAQRNVDGSNNELVPAQWNVDGFNDELVPAQRNVDGSNNELVPTQRNLDGSNDALVLAGMVRQMQEMQAMQTMQAMQAMQTMQAMQAIFTSGQQAEAGGQSSRSVSVVNSKNVSISTRQSIPGALAQATLNLRMNEAKHTFVPTGSYKEVQKKLDQFGHVTVCGASGEGKTTMALMLAKDFLEKGYGVVFVEKVDAFDFDECISSTHRLILILDDIFGNAGLSTDVSHLRNLLNSLKSHIDDSRQMSSEGFYSSQKHESQAGKEQENNKDIRVVFTSKTYNFQNGISELEYHRMTMFTGHTVVDVTTDKDYCYSVRERIAIFQQHKNMYPTVAVGGISEEDLLSLDKTLFGFPLTCRLFFEFAAFKGSGIDFFKHPLFYLRIDISKVLSQKNNQSAALILMLLCDDKLDLAKLELQGRDHSMDEMMKHVTDIVPFATHSGIATAARSFKGTFFSGGDTLRFAHSCIYDALAVVMFRFNRRFVLQFCSLDFLYERLKSGPVDESRSTDHLHFLFVSYNYFDLIATRLIEAMREGHFSKTVTNPILKNEQFVQLLLKNLRIVAGLGDTHWIQQKDRGRGFLYWAVQGYSPLLVQEIEKIMNIRFTQSEISEALEGCVEKDNLLVLKQLFSRHEIQSHFQTKNKLLLLNAKNGSWKIAEYLLNEGADINISTEKKQNFVHLLCQFGNSESLRALKEHDSVVSQIQTAIHSVDINGRTPIMIAALYGSWNCFHLLSNDYEHDMKDIDGSTVLHLASYAGNLDIVQHVLTPSNINSRGCFGWTPVLGAAVSGQLSVFDFLVSHSADLTLVSDSGDSLLHLACRGGNRDIVQHVLTLSNINSRGRYGLTPAMKAAVNGQLSVFDFLVSNNADLTLVGDGGDSLLHLACQGGNRDIVQHVLTPSNINSRGRYGWTPVLGAAVSGQLSVFDFLVSHSADLTLVSDSGDSLLHLACRGGNRDIVQHVLTLSNINSRGRFGWTPAMKAAVNGQLSVFDFLVSNNADLSLVSDSGDSLLHLACQGGNRDIVQHVLTLSNINSRGRYGRTPAMKAAVSGQLSVFDFLVSNNADLTLVDDGGDSLLHLACRGGNRDIVQHVLTTSNINSRGRYGRTPVMVAAVSGQLSVFDFLVSNNADLTLVDDGGDSLLHLACEGGNRDIVQHVLTPSNINSRGRYGWTPAMKAAVSGQLSVFDFLVSNNADLTLVDDGGDSLLHLACRGGDRDIVQHVLTPSNINSRGRNGKTPAMNAAVNGQLSVFDFLVSHSADLTLVSDGGDSLLHLACQGGNRDIVQHVLTPSNINSRGRYGWTPAMKAAVSGQLSVFDFLVSNNADLTLVDDGGDSLLHLACRGGDRDILQHVLTPSNINSRGRNGKTPAMNAAVNGQLSVFDFLVSNNADLTLVSDSGDSLLHLACQGGNMDIVQHVLTPSTINSRGWYGWTPVMVAAVSGQLSVFDFLDSNNADLTLANDSGDSLLDLACKGGNKDIVQHVLTPSNINSRGRCGWTPAMNAAVNGQLRVFDFLVSNNADLTLVSDNGDSLLHLACEGGNRGIVQHVLTPSNINSRGCYGWTPVMVASYCGHRNIIDLLVENQADLSLTDTYGSNFVRCAIDGGKTDVAEYLKSLEL